jgi:hypothetical protein
LIDDSWQLVGGYCTGDTGSGGTSEGGDSSSPQYTAEVPLPDLGKGMEKQLENKGCADFVEALLKQNAAANPQDPLQGTSLMDLFGRIGQENYVLQRDLNMNGTAINGTVSGSIARGDARILLRTRDYYTTDTARQISRAVASGQLEYVMSAMHETFHLAGTYGGGWNDERLARTALGITGDQEHFPNPSTATVLDWSSYFNRQLYSKCAPGFRGY